jgi:glutathionylspermidine amidase/synthetase
MSHIKGYVDGVAIYHNPKKEKETYHVAKKTETYDGIRYGIKYQCVEFVRRYYIKKFHSTFPEVDNAYELFDLKYATDLQTNKKVRLRAIPNSIQNIPEPGDMIIWKPEGRYRDTGHVAIMKEIVNRSIVTIVEQNGKTHNGQRNIQIHHPGILGWMRLDDNQ